MKAYGKKIGLLSGCALATLLLGACGGGPAPGAPGSVVNSQSPQPAKATLDSVDYKIEKQDQSVRDAHGNVLVQFTYEQVVLSGSQPEITAINRGIQQNCNTFLDPEKREEMESIANNMVKSGLLDPQKEKTWYLFNTTAAEVTENADGLFSIKLTAGWYMGGVMTQDYHGLNYNLHTGQPANLTELLGQDEGSATATLRDIVSKYLQQDPKVYCFADNLSKYTSTDKFDFYVQDGTITLVFPTYEFAPGVVGPTVIPTGLTVQPLS